ncbi:MAG: hypothetical protein M1817_001266 [Caeruleum heppii]|nr:MAG: hypothetical protein M1817_001266 [Caeruleum heppii]
MDPQFGYVSREDIWRLHSDMKTVHAIQADHSDRLIRLERRQEDDARLRSVWGTSSPFPSVLSGTPQQDPVVNPPGNDFANFDENHQNNLLSALHLDQEEEPRRGASRANSVRFDETATQSHWAHGSRSSGDFLPLKAGNGGVGGHPMTERSLSHKSDGRQSSAGQSVHSHHSGPSARTSSLGLDTTFATGQPLNPPELTHPPPGLFILGPVPSIIRCWLDTNFSHDSLLYAVVCTGSYDSFLDSRLVARLDLTHRVFKDNNSEKKIKMPVYLPEAIVRQPSSRSSSPVPQLPSLTVDFTVVEGSSDEHDKPIQIFIGSDTLRSHSADILLSQNIMTLVGDDHSRLSVPLVRPEDEGLFKRLRTQNVEQSLAKGGPGPISEQVSHGLQRNPPNGVAVGGDGLVEPPRPSQPTPALDAELTKSTVTSSQRAHRSEGPIGRPSAAQDFVPPSKDTTLETAEADLFPSEDESNAYDKGPRNNGTEASPADSGGGIWGSWRREQGPKTDASNGASSSSSGYQRPGRGRGMKVLRPAKSSISSTRSPSGSHAIEGSSTLAKTRDDSDRAGSASDEPQRSVSGESKTAVGSREKETRTSSTTSRSSNPVGGASAFAWLNGGATESGQHKRSATMAD